MTSSVSCEFSLTLRSAMGRETFRIPAGIGFCNAVRRTLASELSMEAPCSVHFRTNSSPQTDEFVAHRLGLIPFRRVGNGDTMALRAKGPCIVTAGDLTGPAFDAVHPDIRVVVLAAQQEIDATITFDTQSAATHARYGPVAGLGMEVCADGCSISFETIDGRTCREALASALDRLDGRIDRALHALAHQPAVAPRSMC